MNEEKTFTDVDIIADAVATIGRLTIQVDQVDTLGAELNRIRNNLTEVLKAKQAQAVAVNPAEEENPETVTEEVIN